MFTLEYDGCAWLGILKVFWERKNIESRKKMIMAKAMPDLQQTDSFSRDKSWGKNGFQQIFTHQPIPWNRFELVLAGQREKVYPDGKEIPK